MLHTLYYTIGEFDDFGDEMNCDMCDDSIDELDNSVVSYNFNGPLESLPPGLTHLEFGFLFNQPIDALGLPAGLTHLKFGWNSQFNQPIESLPSGLTHLFLGGCFNQPISSLPAGLTHLSFGSNFNQPIDTLGLPAGLTHLEFSWCSEFNQPLDTLGLPSGLTHLSFGSNFNQPIDTLGLPAGLTHLKFSWCSEFNQPLKINYVYHNTALYTVLCKNDKLKMHHYINHIKLQNSSLKTIKQVKSIQNHFKTNVAHELIQQALHPRRIEYSLLQSNGSLDATLGGFS